MKNIICSLRISCCIVLCDDFTTQASIHASAQDIRSIEQQIDETKKQNTDLSIQVSELSTYERVWEKAKALGLKLNETKCEGRTGTMKKKFRFQWGAFLMFLFYGGLFFLLLSRMIFIQVTGEADGQALAAKAAAKYEREQVINSSRGKILDKHGGIIAEDTLSYRLVAVLSPRSNSKCKKSKTCK